MIDMNMKLGPCPRCGGPAVIDSYMQWADGDESVSVRCLKCGLSLDYFASKYYPRTSVKWDYEIGKYIPLDQIWNVRKDDKT